MQANTLYCVQPKYGRDNRIHEQKKTYTTEKAALFFANIAFELQNTVLMTEIDVEFTQYLPLDMMELC